MLHWSDYIWNTQFRKVTEELERIQIRATKMGRPLEAKSYKEQWKDIGIFSLKKRQRGNITAALQYMNGYLRDEIVDLYSTALEYKTRSFG